jgi:hypothetical protein
VLVAPPVPETVVGDPQPPIKAIRDPRPTENQASLCLFIISCAPNWAGV